MNQKQDMIDTEETMLPEPDAALLPYMEKLYPLTFALKQHKPWKTIYEYEAFAVRLPDGTPACCLLTGMEGDFISLSVYSGETGWNNIHKFWETPDGLDKTQENYQELMMSQSCLQVVFCCKDDLAAAEVESLRRYAKENGITFRGKNAYFCFRSAKPYHATWFLENETQADILETALHAALDIAAQLEQGKTKQELGLLPLFRCPAPVCSHCGRRSLGDAGDSGRDRSHSGRAAPGRCHAAETAPDEKRRRQVGVPAVPVPGPGSCQRGRTVFPFLMLILDTKRDQLLPQQPLQYNDAVLQQALDGFVQAVIDYGRCPKSIAVCDKRTEAALSGMCRSCGILLLRTTRFAMLDEAKASFLDDVNPKEEGGATLEEVVALLEQMPDGELANLPKESIQMMLEEKIPEKLRKRLKTALEAK